MADGYGLCSIFKELHPKKGFWDCMFYKGKIDNDVLRNTHVWGCPTYILDSKIYDGKKLPCWQPKS